MIRMTDDASDRDYDSGDYTDECVRENKKKRQVKSGS